MMLSNSLVVLILVSVAAAGKLTKRYYGGKSIVPIICNMQYLVCVWLNSLLVMTGKYETTHK